MFRFMGFLWSAGDPAQSERADFLANRLLRSTTPWREVISQRAQGLRVFCIGSRPGLLEAHALPLGAGAILGSIFPRNHDFEIETPSERVNLGERESAAIIRSSGRKLVSGYWGNYVAFLCDPESRTKWVIKDPTGDLPCFKCSYQDVAMFFSYLPDCIALRAFPLTVNWAYVRHRLGGGGCAAQYNSLNEIQQVLRGEVVTFTQGAEGVASARRFYWNPLEFSESADAIEDPGYAIRALHATVLACTHTLAKGHAKVLQQLSGGLDSSIVLGCLKRAPNTPEITAYTYHNPRGRSNELRWAKMAADHAECRHVECPFDPAKLKIDGLAGMGPSVEPLSVLMHFAQGPLERSLASQHSCTAVFSGNGGDSSLGSESIRVAVDDYLRRHGIGKRALTLAARVGSLKDQTAWSVLAVALHRKIVGGRMSDFTEIYRAGKFVSADIQQPSLPSNRFPHPWFSDTNSVPWPTIFRIGALTFTPDYYDPFVKPDQSLPERLYPLYSQPVVELCLRIPVYVHFLEGRDRGVARKAFVREVPQPILRRQWKDRGPGFLEELTDGNRAFLQELLLDGILAREKLLNRSLLAAALTNEIKRADFSIVELYSLLYVETWLRSVTEDSRYTAAA